MFCSECGNKLSENSRFCSQCGRKIESRLENDSQTINNNNELAIPIIQFDNLKSLNYFEGLISNTSSIDELNSCLLNFLSNECNKCRLINSEDFIESMGNIKLNSDTIQFLYSIPKFILWNNASSKIISNVSKYFSPSEKYGEILGFIDGGNLLRRGSSGLLFCANGIAVRGLMDENAEFISYNMICKGVLRRNSKFTLSKNKFKVSEDKLNVIETSDKILGIMNKIRSTLFATDSLSKAVFYSEYSTILNNIEKTIKSDITDADKWADFFNEYSASNTVNGYKENYAIKTAIAVIGYDFKKAKTFVDKSNHAELSDFVCISEDKYKVLRNQEAYEKARDLCNDGNYDEALEFARIALSYLSTNDSWKIYINIVFESANRNQKIYDEDINRILDISISSPEEQICTYQLEKGKIDFLYKKFLEYSKERSFELINIIRNADIHKSKIGEHSYIDNYGMSLYMYSALCPEYKSASSIIAGTELKNILGLDRNDLLAFACRDVETYLNNDKVFGKQDKWYINRKRKYESELLKLKEDLSKVKKICTVGNALDKIPTGVELSDAKDSFNQEIRVITEDIEWAKKKYEKDITNHFEEHSRRVRRIIFDHAALVENELPILLSKGASLDEYLKYPYYESYYKRTKQWSLASDDLDKRNEFETTEQYEKRKVETLKKLEDEFNETILDKLYAYQFELYSSRKENNLKVNCARAIMEALICLSHSKFELDTYDADEQKFYIIYNDVFNGSDTSDISINVPIEEAPEFKRLFNLKMYDLHLKISSVNIVIREEVFKYVWFTTSGFIECNNHSYNFEDKDDDEHGGIIY